MLLASNPSGCVIVDQVGSFDHLQTVQEPCVERKSTS